MAWHTCPSSPAPPGTALEAPWTTWCQPLPHPHPCPKHCWAQAAASWGLRQLVGQVLLDIPRHPEHVLGLLSPAKGEREKEPGQLCISGRLQKWHQSVTGTTLKWLFCLPRSCLWNPSSVRWQLMALASRDIFFLIRSEEWRFPICSFQAFEPLGTQTLPIFLLYLWFVNVHVLNLYFYTTSKKLKKKKIPACVWGWEDFTLRRKICVNRNTVNLFSERFFWTSVVTKEYEHNWIFSNFLGSWKAIPGNQSAINRN